MVGNLDFFSRKVLPGFFHVIVVTLHPGHFFVQCVVRVKKTKTLLQVVEHEPGFLVVCLVTGWLVVLSFSHSPPLSQIGIVIIGDSKVFNHWFEALGTTNCGTHDSHCLEKSMFPT